MNKKTLTTKLLVFTLSAFVLSTALLVEPSIGFFPMASAANYTIQQTTSNKNLNSLQGYALFVPAGVTCRAVLSQEINSKTAVSGQTINALLTEDFVYNGKVIAASGSTIMGSIVNNKQASYGNRNAKMQVRFTAIRTPYNNIIPISATIMTNDSSGVLKAGSTKDSAKDYAKTTAIGAGAGAALGTAMGALAGGSVGKGAIYGTALGAGLGALKTTTNKGEEIKIPAGSQINLLFDQPITFTAQ